MRKINLVGQKFGRLGVVKRVATSDNKPWECLCSCGNIIKAATSHLKKGNVKSCGCLKKEKENLLYKENRYTYSSYSAMKTRCRHKMDNYESVSICERWLSSFENFLKDMGSRPPNTELDRINNSKGYFPDNCRWSSLSVQMYNRNKFKNNTSGKTGVYFRKDSLKWRAIINVKGKSISLGSFDSFEEAVKHREQAEIKYYNRGKD